MSDDKPRITRANAECGCSVLYQDGCLVHRTHCDRYVFVHRWRDKMRQIMLTEQDVEAYRQYWLFDQELKNHSQIMRQAARAALEQGK